MTVRVDEQVAWCLARSCRPGDVLVVGVATPLAAAAGQLARELLTPDLVLIEAASVGVPTHDVAEPLISPDRFSAGALAVYAQTEILDAIQRGRVTLQFLSPAQIDGAGNLNTSRVRAPDGSLRRLPGGLATADVAVLMGRLVVYRVGHSARFLPDRVDFVTGAAGRVARIVTSAAVLDWDGERFRVASVHAGQDKAGVVAGCGFPLEIPDRVATTELPPPEALRLLREEIDPHGLCRLETREGRDEALRALEAMAHAAGS